MSYPKGYAELTARLRIIGTDALAQEKYPALSSDLVAAADAISILQRERDALRIALERARGCIKGLLARTPVRDVAETLAEMEAALQATELTGAEK